MVNIGTKSTSVIVNIVLLFVCVCVCVCDRCNSFKSGALQNRKKYQAGATSTSQGKD
jgi:hypothetical protein